MNKTTTLLIGAIVLVALCGMAHGLSFTKPTYLTKWGMYTRCCVIWTMSGSDSPSDIVSKIDVVNSSGVRKSYPQGIPITNGQAELVLTGISGPDIHVEVFTNQGTFSSDMFKLQGFVSYSNRCPAA